MRSAHHTLSVEVLEARALFAGDGVDAAIQISDVAQALVTTGKIDASFDPNAPQGVYRLMLVGDSNATVKINFDLLPSFITSINVSKFDSIVFEGKDSLVNLIASDVNSIRAPEISVIGFDARNVDFIELKSVSGYASIQGDRVEAHISNFEAVNLTLNVKTLLLDTEALPKQITFWNTRTVIALPHVPSSWDLSSFSGLENRTSQLRIGSSDVTTGVSNELSTNPLTTFPTDLHARGLLDRLEVLFKQTGGFDAKTLQRIVQELDRGQQTLAGGVAAEVILRREGNPALVAETSGATSFGDVARAPIEVVVKPDMITTDFAVQETSTVSTAEGFSADAGRAIVTTNPLLPANTANQAGVAVQVTVDPTADIPVPQPTVWGVISQLVERGMNLKQYLLDQLAQGLVPGERDSVLLVDPKPVRHSQQTRDND